MHCYIITFTVVLRGYFEDRATKAHMQSRFIQCPRQSMSFRYIQIIYTLPRRVTVVETNLTYNLNVFLSEYFDFLCWTDITLSPNPHTTSCAFIVQPAFSDFRQLLVESSEYHGGPDQILLNSCMIIVTYMERESTTETLGMIISYCRGLAIKIIAMVTVDKVLTFTNDSAILFIT